MPPFPSRWTLGLVAVTFAGLACGGQRDGSAAAHDSTLTGGDSAGAPSSAAAVGPTRVEGFQGPESAQYDAELDVWYVSNINGSPVDRDGNGYISRLKGDGTVDSLKFIVSGVNGVKLDAPKGLALQGDTLWVADIVNLRGFNRKTGAVVASVPSWVPLVLPLTCL